MSYRKKAKIELYIIHQSTVKGDCGNQACIDDIDWLIGFASRRTNKLLNIHGARPTSWSIVGIANHGKCGHPGSSVLLFKTMMGMATKKPKGFGKSLISEDTEIQPQTVESVSPDTEEAASIEQDVGGDDALEVTSGSAVGPDPCPSRNPRDVGP